MNLIVDSAPVALRISFYWIQKFLTRIRGNKLLSSFGYNWKGSMGSSLCYGWMMINVPILALGDSSTA